MTRHPQTSPLFPPPPLSLSLSPAAATKPFVALVGKATRRARGGEREAALATEAPALAVLGPASARLHGCASVSEIRGGSDRDRRVGCSRLRHVKLTPHRAPRPGAIGRGPTLTRPPALKHDRAHHHAHLRLLGTLGGIH